MSDKPLDVHDIAEAQGSATAQEQQTQGGGDDADRSDHDHDLVGGEAEEHAGDADDRDGGDLAGDQPGGEAAAAGNAAGGGEAAGGGAPRSREPRSKRQKNRRTRGQPGTREPGGRAMDHAHNPPDGDYRQGVAAILIDHRGYLLICERMNPANSWQFPQGGIAVGELESHALIRELGEEIGVLPHDVCVLAVVLPRFKYTLKKNNNYFKTRGQEHRYYVLQLRPGARVDLNADKKPEFRSFKFVPYGQFPFDLVFDKKREIYREVLDIIRPMLA